MHGQSLPAYHCRCLYHNFALGFLHIFKQPEAADAELRNGALLFYRSKELEVKTVVTDNGHEFHDKYVHPYELYTKLNDIERRHTQVNYLQTNDLVE